MKQINIPSLIAIFLVGKYIIKNYKGKNEESKKLELSRY